MHAANDWAHPGPPRTPLRVGEVLPPRVRVPQSPLKDRRTLFTDAEIAQARENIALHPSARELADGILEGADYWAAWEDGALRNLIAGAEVPRAFDCSPAGCPTCGKRIFELAQSTYPWRIDPRRPFKVQCPLCESVFPSNDYGRFYRSGFKDRSDFDGPFVDDGRGWTAPDGGRYWFVAHANHWTWYWHPQADNPSLIRACEHLGRAYLLSGQTHYAHKAAVILHRVAEVYPNMDHDTQSRYGEIHARVAGERYTGKVVNAIWESYLSAQLAETYDAIWETIDSDAALHALAGGSGPAIRACIEANILEEVLDGYYDWKTRGNYGMHQRSLLQTALVRQHAGNARHLEAVLDRPDGAVFLGLRYALCNLVWRDGHPYEVGDYNFSWVQNLTAILGLLGRLGVGVGDLPRLRRLFDAPLDSICAGRFTPAIGDSQTVYGSVVGEDPAVYQEAVRMFGDERHLQFLSAIGATGTDSFRSFASLLHPPVPAPASAPADGRRLPPQPSRLLSGFGLSVLNNPTDTVAASLYHGLHVTHRHFDRLHFDIFANGQAMMPDLGYPDAMNTMVAGVYTWSLSTIAHNTVTVDAGMQPGNAAGVVELQADGGWARAVAVNAPGTYPQCGVYRRTLVMIDVGPARSYFVDVFEVEGGSQHDYSLHGPPGEFALEGPGEWTAPAPGTLAGENVGVGELYDAPELASPENTRGFMDYRGSGFQHLTRVRRHRGGPWSADYSHERDSSAQLRLRVLPQEDQEIMVAEARVSPVKWPQILRYVIARRTSATEGLHSRFVGVIEPHSGNPFLRAADRVELETGEGAAVLVRHADGPCDVILVGTPGERRRVAALGSMLASDARVAVFRFGATGALLRLWFVDGQTASVGDVVHRAGASLRGRVVAADASAQTVHVSPEGKTMFDPAALVGRVVHFINDQRSANTVTGVRVEGGTWILTVRDDLLIGRFRVRAVAGRRLESASRLMLAPTYPGAGLQTADGRWLGRVAAAGDTWVESVHALPADAVRPGDDCRITQTSPGDALEVAVLHSWDPGGTMRGDMRLASV